MELAGTDLVDRRAGTGAGLIISDLRRFLVRRDLAIGVLALVVDILWGNRKLQLFSDFLK